MIDDILDAICITLACAAAAGSAVIIAVLLITAATGSGAE